MLHETMEINLDYAALNIPHDDTRATLTSYILDRDEDLMGAYDRPLILICPGGGYGHLSFREGEPVAIRMNSLGYNACVLRYSLVPNAFPCQLFELACAISFIRANAKIFKCNPDKIIVAGFSAGGHLAACLGTMWHDDYISSYLNIEKELLKPNGLLLGYPVITSGQFAHRDSFLRLLGSNYNGLLEEVSIENRVNEYTPKTFMWHTFKDNSVPLENSLLMAQALRAHNIPFEYHVFPRGSHGLALCTQETNTKDGTKIQPENACWIDMFKNWADRL